jgi:hypothetical protein
MSNETEAEAAILGAVMSDGAPPVSQPDAQDLDEPTRIDAVEEEGAPEAADDQKADAGAKEDASAADEDDYLEIDGEDGAEPTKLKVSLVYEGYKQFKAIEAQKTDVVERVQREAVQEATRRLGEIETVGKQAGYMVQAALQLLRPPTPPDPRDQKYEYDQRQYQIDMFNYQQGMTQHQQAQDLGQKLLAQAQQAAMRAQDERDTVELHKLNRAWPEFGERETMEKFVSDMSKAYGFTPQELDEVLVDHRQAIVARDALAYRAMKAQSGDVKAKVEAKAPKLVRSKQEAKGGAQQRDRDGKGQFVAGTYQRAMKSGSDQDWANHFAALSKAGRI